MVDAGPPLFYLDLDSPNPALIKESATMRRIPVALAFLSLTLPVFWVDAQESTKVPKDSRLGPPKDYNGYFPWTPPKTKEEWARRRQEVREQVLVATGLWPMPEKMPLKPVIHGKVEREGYTIE